MASSRATLRFDIVWLKKLQIFRREMMLLCHTTTAIVPTYSMTIIAEYQNSGYPTYRWGLCSKHPAACELLSVPMASASLAPSQSAYKPQCLKQVISTKSGTPLCKYCEQARVHGLCRTEPGVGRKEDSTDTATPYKTICSVNIDDDLTTLCYRYLSRNPSCFAQMLQESGSKSGATLLR